MGRGGLRFRNDWLFNSGKEPRAQVFILCQGTHRGPGAGGDRATLGAALTPVSPADPASESVPAPWHTWGAGETEQEKPCEGQAQTAKPRCFGNPDIDENRSGHFPAPLLSACVWSMGGGEGRRLTHRPLGGRLSIAGDPKQALNTHLSPCSHPQRPHFHDFHSKGKEGWVYLSPWEPQSPDG